MSFKDAEASVQGWFNTKWNGLTDIAWPDVDFTPPDDTWVRFDMKNNVGAQSSMGAPTANRFRRLGIVTIQVFQKEGRGGVDARTKADVAVNAFMDNDLSGFEFFNVNARAIGNFNGWYQWNVTAEYQYDIIT